MPVSARSAVGTILFGLQTVLVAALIKRKHQSCATALEREVGATIAAANCHKHQNRKGLRMYQMTTLPAYVTADFYQIILVFQRRVGTSLCHDCWSTAVLITKPQEKFAISLVCEEYFISSLDESPGEDVPWIRSGCIYALNVV